MAAVLLAPRGIFGGERSRGRDEQSAEQRHEPPHGDRERGVDIDPDLATGRQVCEALLARVPESARNKACICAACVGQAAASQGQGNR